ncbi:hypothetical protein A4S05_03345 [Nostoc sp. KVJ20]|nr:hypothetical protein A4S05_03345 [Nostoc sp. KVJ20]
MKEAGGGRRQEAGGRRQEAGEAGEAEEAGEESYCHWCQLKLKPFSNLVYSLRLEMLLLAALPPAGETELQG